MPFCDLMLDDRIFSKQIHWNISVELSAAAVDLIRNVIEVFGKIAGDSFEIGYARTCVLVMTTRPT